MGEQLVVAYGVGLAASITGTALGVLPRRASAGHEGAECVSLRTIRQRLVECDPLLHPIAELLEANVGVVFEVLSA